VGLVELLIALAISAALLTAVGVAVDASFKSYETNQEQSSLTQRARLTMYRMLTTIRTAAEHQPATPALAASFAAGTTVTDTGIRLFDSNDQQIDFIYDEPSQELRLIEGGNTHVLLRGVQDFQIKMQPMRSAAAIKSGSAGYDKLMRSTILITVGSDTKSFAAGETTGRQTVTISSSVMPRRNVW
jgi:hypothetical protein